MVQLEVRVEFETRYKVSMTNAAHDLNYFDGQALVFDFQVVSYEAVIFEPNGNHLPIRTDIETQWLSIMVFALESQGHLKGLEIEEPNVMIITGSDKKEDLVCALVIVSLTAARLLRALGSASARWRVLLVLIRFVKQLTTLVWYF